MITIVIRLISGNIMHTPTYKRLSLCHMQKVMKDYQPYKPMHVSNNQHVKVLTSMCNRYTNSELYNKKEEKFTTIHLQTKKPTIHSRSGITYFGETMQIQDL